MFLNLISLNIEGSKHLDVVLPFLKTEGPDIICLQELREADIARFENELQMQAYYLPTREILTPVNREQPLERVGVAILSALSCPWQETFYYGDFNEGYVGTVMRSAQHTPLLVAHFSLPEKAFRVAVTHFTWSPEGQATDAQRTNVQRLLYNLKRHPDLLLCGDFNAPRGGEIFDLIAQHYTDTIPPEITTSIDPTLHHAGPLQLMVDGLFSAGYQVTNVRLQAGLSDHQAVIAQLSL